MSSEKTASGNTVTGSLIVQGDATVERNLTVVGSTNLGPLNVTSLTTPLVTTTVLNATAATINTANVATATITTGTIIGLNAPSANIGTFSGNTGDIYHLQTEDFNINAPSMLFNSFTFYYSSGTWTPILTYVTDDSHGSGGLKDFVTLGTSVAVFQEGWYERMGSKITAYFNVKYTANGQTPGTDGALFPAIRNFPFKFTTLGGGTFTSTTSLEDSAWPNGLAGSVPAPLLIATYPGPYTGTIFPEGSVQQLYQQIFPAPVYVGTHTYDGYTMPLYGRAEFYVPVVALPPYAQAAATNGLIDNINMTIAATNVEFQGCIVYNVH